MRHKLEAEFGKIDLNKDEFVDAEELKSYFRNQKVRDLLLFSL